MSADSASLYEALNAIREREAELDRQDNLHALEEERDVAKARSAFYQQQA